jgi:signal transduction histidine kinase
MDPAEADVERRWRLWLVERNRRGLRIGLVIMITLYPAFGLLDWLMAPREALGRLWATRIVIAAVTLALFRVLRSPVFERWGEWITAGYAWLGGAGVTAMTGYMGGLESPYYAGVSLMLLATGLLLVWRPPVVLVTYSSVVGTFILGNLATNPIGSLTVVLSNLAFLCTTALVAAVGQILYYRTQREQLAQRVRLEQTTLNLERAHADLRRLEQFKSRFFANITHELRTPLAMVLTPLELMLEGEMGDFSEAQRSSFQTMFKSALKLLKLIDDLLDLSRLEESRLELNLAEHDLVEQLRALTDQSQVLARRKTIALQFRADSEHVLIWCDPERLERVFINLLSNAIKFTQPSGHVTVSLYDRAGAAEVVVEDDGPGFPPDRAAKLFERFYQVDMGGTRERGGAGIGLALAREFVLLHGGTIEARSDGHSGARFTVSLPKGKAHVRRDARIEARPEPEGAMGRAAVEWPIQLSRRQDFRLIDIEEAAERRAVERDGDEHARPYTAVVVEDHPQVVRLIHMALRRHFRVFTAADGLRGLDLVIQQRPNLVVTDLMMPGIDGLELTRRLKEDGRTRHIPIVMLTARGELEDRVKGLETGVNVYLRKPFSPKELITCARQLVEAKEETADLVLTHRMESLEIVAAGLAHEINNPLNYVKNSLARVRLDAEKALSLALQSTAGPLDDGARAALESAAKRMRQFLEVAESGIKRIGGTVELMGRYGRGGFRREMVPHDAWEAVRTVVGVVLPATGRHVQVELDLGGDGTLECVPEELNQVLTNLLQNAIEAAPDGPGRVHVNGAIHGEMLTLHVKDNGPGIDPETQARLFTPFFTTKGPGRGIGLGLTISRRVVQSLGGTLQVVSAPGEGADFVVHLPRRRKYRAEQAPAS